MRYQKGHKESTRRRVVEVASRAFRRDGIVATGVAGLMAEAGLTQGGFYAHFDSKDALIEAALDAALAATRDNLASRIETARTEGRSPLGAVIDDYLSEFHAQSPEIGCAFASLGAEIARQSDDIRRSAAARIDAIVSTLAAELPEARSHQAGPLFAMLAGTLHMARLAGTDDARAAILTAGRRAARALVGLDAA